MKTIAKMRDNKTGVVYCAPLDKKQILINFGYEYIGNAKFDSLDTNCKKMLSEFDTTKEFNYISHNWLPIYTTITQRSKFDKQNEQFVKESTRYLNSLEYWNTGMIKNRGFLQNMIAKELNKG